ncbi:putative RNA polymerase ECF subfamily sigma factor [Ilumatobacter coccineus YM16-304]|uniref:Putative RNA polymerase ECF subfamily sigma factor n=1 Tax=Ilumatobacter coccineus (strain NBRC 103263 / KCTC 29153 / YM16-304) TaxID=1313172 RepID=A0A6C7EDC5_ILUCY|nr:putative RNA polymerase ECF subfamily sigma factor [Ilumatobacter coccineus YM16-304]
MTAPLTRTVDDAFVRVQQGDQAAFAVFYDLLSARVLGAISRVLRDPAMSEEVAQEVFVELWRTAARFDAQRGNVTAWAITIARRRAVDRVRREQSQRNRIDELGEQRVTPDDGPADEVVSSMEVTRVRAAVATLPDDQREVIELSFIDGIAHTDIADRLGLPLGTVKGRVRGGLRKLRGQLGSET